MTQPEAETDTADVLFHTILGFTLPFFLTGAGKGTRTEPEPGTAEPGKAGPREAEPRATQADDDAIACAAIIDLIDAYNAATPRELDLVGRIIGFSAAAMDDLRLSMQPDLPDTKILRYRANAVSLSRSSDRCQAMLDKLQAARRAQPRAARPPVQATPTPTLATPTLATPTLATPALATPTPAPTIPAATTRPIAPPAGLATTPEPPVRPQAPPALIPATAAHEKLRQDARALIEALHAKGGELSGITHPSFTSRGTTTPEAGGFRRIAATG